MGYTTEFQGQFHVNKTIDEDTKKLINGIASTRRMKRQGLPEKFGVDGEFYYDPYTSNFGQDSDEYVVDYNTPPRTQPGLWLQWIVSDCGNHIHWDGNEKCYSYVEWLQYLIDKILAPRGYELSGYVHYYGEERSDFGTLSVENGKVVNLYRKVI